jgi:hypothetical protein
MLAVLCDAIEVLCAISAMLSMFKERSRHRFSRVREVDDGAAIVLPGQVEIIVQGGV